MLKVFSVEKKKKQAWSALTKQEKGILALATNPGIPASRKMAEDVFGKSTSNPLGVENGLQLLQEAERKYKDNGGKNLPRDVDRFLVKYKDK